MGKLRIEPKIKPLLKEEEYNFYKGALEEAKQNAKDNRIYWDLDPGEDSGKVKKAFLYVAEKEGISLSVRAKRGAGSLTLNLGGSGGPRKTGKRISSEECVRRIIDVLNKSDKPLNKSQIVNAACISGSTWNVRVKEMLSRGEIMKKGSGRQTTYYLP